MALQKKLSPRQQRFLLQIGGLGALILCLYGGFIIWPLLSEAGAIKGKLQAATQELLALRTVTARQALLQGQHKQLLDSLHGWRARLPEQNNASTAIEHVSQLAGRSGLKVLMILPVDASESLSEKQANAGLQKPYRAIPLQMEAVGGYHQLGRMIASIESSQSPMKVVGLRISNNEKDATRHRIYLEVEAFVLSEAESVRTDSGKAKAS